MTNKQRVFPFVQLDVFSARPLLGNPLAVFLDARGLSDGEMQALAKEMNLSETTFILPRDPQVEQERGVRVRIFTVEEELPFAGHPTLGTALALRNRAGGPAPAEIFLDLNVGKIPVSFSQESSGALFGEMQQRDPEFLGRHPREEVARACGLRIEDLDADLPVETISTGVPFTIVPVRWLHALQNLQLDQRRAAQYLDRSGGKFFYFICQETVQPESRLHARMIFYSGEDPATGSAAGCAAAWMVAHGVARPGESSMIEQGIEMGRPSRIVVRADKSAGNVVNVRVGGNAVQVLQGEVTL